LRAVAGRRQPFFSRIVVVLALASVLRGPTWALFGAIAAVFIGTAHPPVENDDEPLDFGRQLVAAACLAVFLMCFCLVPIRIL